MQAPPTSRLELNRCSINTATLGHRSPIESVIDNVARNGFGGIAPWRRDLEGRNVSEVSRHIREAGLKVSGLCRSTYFPARTRQQWQDNVDDNRRALDDAAALAAPCFVMVVGGLHDGARDLGAAREQVVDGLSDLLDHARGCGVDLALEPLHPMYAADRSCVSSLGEALAICERLDPERYGGISLTIDVYHVWWDWQLGDLIQRAGAAGRIGAFHVCDWLVPTQDLLLDRGMMGDGVIDIAGIRALVDRAGYEGFVETEIFSNHWWGQPEGDVLAVCAERMKHLC